MICGSCKTANVSIGHVKACYSTKYGKPATVTGVKPTTETFVKVTAIPFQPKAPAKAPVSLPKRGRYTVDNDGVLIHFYVEQAKSGKGFFVKTIHGDNKVYVGFLFNNHSFKPGAEKINYADEVASFVADPIKAALLYAKTTGRCALCGKTLTVADSVEQGFGPVCWKNLQAVAA